MRNRMSWISAAALAAIIVSMGAPSSAQTGEAATDSAGVDSTVTPPAAAPATMATAPPVTTVSSKPPLRDRIYYGGSVVLSFGGDVSRVGIYPMIAYKMTPKLSLGLEVGYEHVTYDDFDQSADNYGGSVFSNYRLLPKIYLHAEYQLVSYELFTGLNTSDRELVPFLLLGGGVSTQISQRTWAYAEILFDVLQDDKSPYDDWEPVISLGIGVGF